MSEYLELAAQVWCKKSVEHKQMDVELATAFAETLEECVTAERKRVGELEEALEFLFKSHFECMYYEPTGEYVLLEREKMCPLKTVAEGRSVMACIQSAMKSSSTPEL